MVEKAKRAMTFVLLQEAACSIPQGFLLQQRRDVVFSQAVGGHTLKDVFSYLFVLVHQRWKNFSLRLQTKNSQGLCFHLSQLNYQAVHYLIVFCSAHTLLHFAQSPELWLSSPNNINFFPHTLLNVHIDNNLKYLLKNVFFKVFDYSFLWPHSFEIVHSIKCDVHVPGKREAFCQVIC